MPTELQPELWVSDTAAAVRYYERAFGAVSTASEDMGRFDPASLRGSTGRLLLVVDDPPLVAGRAVAAGGELTSPVSAEHGWLVGRLVDPFGHEWEIGRPLGAWPPAAF